MKRIDVDAVIIGGGAAGLMCAQALGHAGQRVIVLEHANRVGKKILMSGGGRCNFTNLRTAPQNFLSGNPRFCVSALARYSPLDFVALVKKHQIGFHEKELGQLFCDDSSKQIVKMLLDECASAGAQIFTQTEVKSLTQNPHGFSLECTDFQVQACSLVVATGGLSIPSMGASGFGYRIAEQFGHTVLPTRPGLVPLTLSGSYQEQFCALAGLALPVRASVGKISFENALLITHRGLSGPAILQISSYWQPGQSAALVINLLPAGAESLIAHARSNQGSQLVSDWLAQQMPKRFAQRLAEVFPELIQGDSRLADLNKSALTALAQCLSEWPILASGTEGYRTAEVTLGGVDTTEIESKSMQSKKVPGLYFIGEVLDVTGHLGGYNFQWAWASAVAAASAMVAVSVSP